MESSRRSNRGIEENIMAILDPSGVKEARDVDDDRLAFLEAVRAASLVAEAGTAPTRKMLEAIFQILKDGTSLELTMASYQLLSELDKHFPQLHSSHCDTSESSGSKVCDSLVIKETWSPFTFGSENAYSERDATYKSSGDSLDPNGFSLLTQNIAQAFEKIKCQVSVKENLGDMFLFQYLVNVLEHNFLPRNVIYKETGNWALLRESLLSMLLGSRRVNYKSLMKDCLSIISKGSSHHTASDLDDMATSETSTDKTAQDGHVTSSIALIELQNGTCIAVQKFFVLIMELDKTKKLADMQGSTSRADGVRTPLIEIIVDELAYNEDLLFPFLQVFSDDRWKLEIILQYFWKYLPKQPSVRTRRSKNPSEADETFNGVLRCFSSDASTRTIVKKISTDIAQVLLAHAFQAYLSLQHHGEGTVDSSDIIGDSSLLQICKDIVSAFKNLRRTDKHMEVMPFSKEALFAAAVILSTES